MSTKKLWKYWNGCSFLRNSIFDSQMKKSFSNDEELAKLILEIFARNLSHKIIEPKVNELCLSKQSLTRRNEELSTYISEQLKKLAQTCTFLSLALDKSADITDTVQLNIFIKGIDDNFHVFEEFLSWVSSWNYKRNRYIS